MATNWKIQRPLLLLKRGDITFEAFHTMTASDWRKMAAKIHRRMQHRLGGSVDFDDILQEMLASVPKSVEVYDAEAGSMTIGGFVAWRAFAAAKDHINQQCGAYKGRSASPVRAPIAASVGVKRGRTGETVEVSLEQMAAVDADQDWACIVRECRQQVCETLLDRVVMDKLIERGGCIKSIAEALYENEHLRERFNFSSKATTYSVVRRVTQRFVERAEAI
jgi:hypothetical protein